jgi:hypothetical protein
LLENFLDHGVVLDVPVDLGLSHQHRNVSLQGLVVLLQSVLNLFVVALLSRVVDLLGELAQDLDVFRGQLIEAAIGFFGRRLGRNGGFEIFIQFLQAGEEGKEGRNNEMKYKEGRAKNKRTDEGKSSSYRRQARGVVLDVLGQNVSGQIEVLVLAVEQQQIAEGLGRESASETKDHESKREGADEADRPIDQEVEFLESSRRVCVHGHEGLVHQGHWVQLLLRTRRHVVQGFASAVD